MPSTVHHGKYVQNDARKASFEVQCGNPKVLHRGLTLIIRDGTRYTPSFIHLICDFNIYQQISLTYILGPPRGIFFMMTTNVPGHSFPGVRE